MFRGIRKEAIDFLIGIRLNNNEDYYRDHLDIYEQEIKAPLRELNEALTPVVHAMDPQLDTRPGSVIARLRRDTRFTKDKAPFRDHVWMGWRYPGERRSEGFHMYWGFGPDWMGWGCGSYTTDRPLMDNFRQRLLSDPAQIHEIFYNSELGPRYLMSGESYKKMAVPESIPSDLRHLYPLKFLNMDRNATAQEWKAMETPEFVENMIREINAMAPLLQLMKELRQNVQPAAIVTAETTTASAEQPVQESGKIVVRSADEFEF